MPRVFADEKKRVSLWVDRIKGADRRYEDWSTRFECDRLDRYYEGFHWKGRSDAEARLLYTINLIFPTLEMQVPSLMFYRPQVKVEPRAGHVSSANSQAPGRSELLEDTLQTFVDNPDFDFKIETLLALRDGWFRFSITEVGYTADYIDNPNAGKPVLYEDGSAMMKDGTDEPLTENQRTLQTESLFVKHIDPKTFRVSVSNKNVLKKNDWSGYYEWCYVEDLKENKNYKNTDKLKASGRPTGDAAPKADDLDSQDHAGMVKVWKIWDHRRRVRHVIPDGHDFFLQTDQPFSFLPFSVLKFYERSNSFYPLPPMFNWLSPQDEINESREQQRNHRRRFETKYTTPKGKIDDTELEKLTKGGDGTVVIQNGDSGGVSPLIPVPTGELSQSWQYLAASNVDFQRISGVPDEYHGVSNADTATQANIINVRAQIRESQARVQVAEWLSNICRLMAMTIIEKMQLPMWIQMNVDPFSMDAKDLIKTAGEWKQLKAESLGPMDMDVKVDIASLSPISEDALRQAWNQVLALMTNPTLLAILMQPNPDAPTEPSPMLRKTLAFYGIRSDKEVREIARVGKEVLMQMQMMQMAALGAKSEGGPGVPMGGASGAGMPGTPGGPNPGTPTMGPTVQ